MLILTTPEPSTATPADVTANLTWTRSKNGLAVAEHGQCAVSLLPRDEDVVLVLPPRAISWHRLALPKVAGTKLRAVLDGMLEDRVLADCATLHFALEPGGRSGQTVWVAACDKAWLRGWLHTLEAAGRPVARIVPAIWPLAHKGPLLDNELPESVHWAHEASDQIWLASASALGVRLSPLHEDGSGRGDSSLSSIFPVSITTQTDSLAPRPTPSVGSNDAFFADPGVVAVAELALNERFEPTPLSDWLLRCAQTDWNLAQFDLSLSSGARRGQRWRQWLRQLGSAPAWRPARWGLAALVGVQLLGLNVAAWYERRSLDSKQLAVKQTLQQSFPQVSLVLDAPVQMQRELARMQKAGGALTSEDLEAMLAALELPSGSTAAPAAIRFTPGEGHFNDWPAGSPELQSLQQTLQAKGWLARIEGNNLVLRPSGL